MRILVTGAGGFVGRRLVPHLAARGHEVRAAVRREDGAPGDAAELWVGDLADTGDLAPATAGMDAVVHLAARVHIPNDTARDEYHRVNTEMTIRLANAAAASGVARFVFLSTVKVNGEATPDAPYTEDDAPSPADPYGVSKRDAEEALRGSEFGDMEVVIVRPPLVYGPGATANFAALLRLCAAPVPIPLGAARANRRSMIFLDNLIDAIRVATEDPRAAGRTYLVRDGEDISPADLAARIRAALGRRACLVPVPKLAFAVAGRAIGRPGAAERLFGSLCVDDSRIRTELDWHPPFSVDQGLVATVAWYAAQNRRVTP